MNIFIMNSTGPSINSAIRIIAICIFRRSLFYLRHNHDLVQNWLIISLVLGWIGIVRGQFFSRFVAAKFLVRGSKFFF